MLANLLCRTGSSTPAPPPLLLPCLWSTRKAQRSWTHFLLHQQRRLPQHKSASSPFRHWRPRRSGAELTVIAHVASCSSFCMTASTSARGCYPLHCGPGPTGAPIFASSRPCSSVAHSASSAIYSGPDLRSVPHSNLAKTSTPLPCCRQPPWTETHLPLPQEREALPLHKAPAVRLLCPRSPLHPWRPCRCRPVHWINVPENCPAVESSPLPYSAAACQAKVLVLFVDDERSAKCSSCLCLKSRPTLQLYREIPYGACSHAKQLSLPMDTWCALMCIL